MAATGLPLTAILHAATAEAAHAGAWVIVDHVLGERPDWIADLWRRLRGIPVLPVQVCCELGELERREKAVPTARRIGPMPPGRRGTSTRPCPASCVSIPVAPVPSTARPASFPPLPFTARPCRHRPLRRTPMKPEAHGGDRLRMAALAGARP